jgi:hypothetical protein
MFPETEPYGRDTYSRVLAGTLLSRLDLNHRHRTDDLIGLTIDRPNGTIIVWTCQGQAGQEISKRLPSDV